MTLPDTPPLGASKNFGIKDIFPSEVLNLFRERSFAIFALASFLICIPLHYYYAFTNLYLNAIGVQNADGKMTFGPMSELLCMLLIPWFFRRLGVKYMLVAGMSAWAIALRCYLRTGTRGLASGCCCWVSCCTAYATTSFS